jgi:hypothetical protein
MSACRAAHVVVLLFAVVQPVPHLGAAEQFPAPTTPNQLLVSTRWRTFLVCRVAQCALRRVCGVDITHDGRQLTLMLHR